MIAEVPNSEAEVSQTDYLLWKEEDFEDSIREDVVKLKTHVCSQGLEVRGFALQTETGAVREIDL